MAESQRKIVILVTSHPQMGILLTPYYVKEHADNYLLIEEQATEFDIQLTEIENKCILLANQYSEKNLLLMSFDPEMSPQEFWKKINIKRFQQLVRPFIEKEMTELTKLIVQNNVPLYVKEAGDKLIYTFNRIFTQHPNAQASFYFGLNKKDFYYTIKCYCKKEKLDLLHEKPVIQLTQLPATFILGQNFYTIRNIDASSISPFLKRPKVFSNYSQLKKYLNIIVLPAIQKYPTKCKGLSIFHKSICLNAEVYIKSTANGETDFYLSFKYGDYTISDDSLTYTLPLIENDTLPTVYFFTRDYKKEHSIIKLLQETGLKEDGDAKFSLHNQDLYEWLQNYQEKLKPYLVLKYEKTNSTIYSGKITLKQEISEQTDWFDVHIMVKIGAYTFSFIKFKDNITNKDYTFRLPDGKIVFLPREWFQKYDNFFSIGNPSPGGHIKIKKIHLGVIEQIQSKNEYIQKQLFPVPKEIKATLRQYQIEGYSWLVHLSQNKMGGCLADDMGLGKTLQIITLLQRAYSRDNMEEQPKQASLIIVPTSLIDNWINELKRFSKLNAYIFHDGNKLTEERIERLFSHFNIIIASYGMLWRYIYLFEAYPFLYTILDESQAIKNPTSITYHAAIKLKGLHRFVLTGTPIENSLKDLWSQFNFINPDLLGSVESFQKKFISPITKESNESAAQNLRQIISPFLLRRTKKQVAPELPSLTEETIYCDMTDEQKELYLKERNTIRNLILQDERLTNFTLLSSISKLRQLANHPQMIFKDYEYHSGKMEQIINDFETLRSEGHKVLIFSSFVKHLEIARSIFEEKGWKYSILTGQTRNRAVAIDYFNDNADVYAFFISLKAGGTGLNLTQADYVFLLDPWWNPASEQQALSRAYRIGQDKNVFVYRYITKDSIEEKIQQLQQRKSSLSKEFINTNNPLTSLTDEEWKELLT